MACLLKGTAAQPDILTINVIKGDKIKINLLALLGKINSLTNNLKPSDKGCNNPKVPTTFGPRLRCIAPRIFLSAKVKYATEINNGIISIKILRIVIIIKNIKNFTKMEKIGFEPMMCSYSHVNLAN